MYKSPPTYAYNWKWDTNLDDFYEETIIYDGVRAADLSEFFKWDEKEYKEKTWPNFKNHLQASNKALQRTEALTIEETLNREQVMNVVTDGVVQTFQHILTLSVENTQSVVNINVTNPMTSVEPPLLASFNSHSQSANATTVSDLTIQTLQCQMYMLKTIMNQM